MIRHIMRVLAVFALVLTGQDAHAGITTIQALSFGGFIVKNNNAVHSINVNVSGPGYTYDSAGFIEITPPQHGIYDLDGMTPSTAITSVTVTQTSPLAGASGPNFQMTALQESHPATTDVSGVARIHVGGTAQTSGTGTPYADQTFTGTLQIQVNF
ncbi:MAG: hypothetical protein H6861_02785 [Rhodospirillales bacterium]|nr:hypothetical protein [Rhodospirillales bacterium]